MTESARTTITAYPDGPLIVRGEVSLVDEHGQTIRQPRRTVALCRCGVSAIKPWCDGTHKLTGFRTTPDDPGDAGDAGDADGIGEGGR